MSNIISQLAFYVMPRTRFLEERSYYKILARLEFGQVSRDLTGRLSVM